MPRLTPQQIESIPDLYKSGLSTKKIGEQLNCDAENIRYHLKRKEIKRRKNNIIKINEAQKNTITLLHSKGLSARKIERETKIGRDTVLLYIKKVGLSVNKMPKGQQHYKWNGGYKKTITRKIRDIPDYRKWRNQIVKRDGNQCILCGSQNNIEVDHIIPLKTIVMQYNITTITDTLFADVEILKDTSNGRCLCKCCHLKTETYGNR